MFGGREWETGVAGLARLHLAGQGYPGRRENDLGQGAWAAMFARLWDAAEALKFSADDLRAATKPRNFAIFPTTTLVEIENTHNRAGGVVVPQPFFPDSWRDSAVWVHGSPVSLMLIWPRASRKVPSYAASRVCTSAPRPWGQPWPVLR